MKIKRLLKKVPFFEVFYKNMIFLPKYSSNQKILEQIGKAPYPQAIQLQDMVHQLKRGLSSLPKNESDLIIKIENERKRLQNINGPLNDESLGDGGLYDKGITIQRACEASKPVKPALMPYLLTRAIKPNNTIELGTNVGISSAYIGAALKTNDNNGKIVTLDASLYRQRLAKEVHSNIGLDNISYVDGLFSDTLIESLNPIGSIDLAFIDGHHQYQPTLDYFEKILQFSNPNTVFVFDDIRWTEGMQKAWEEIRNDERLGIVLDFHSVGICMLRKKEMSQRFVFDPIYIL